MNQIVKDGPYVGVRVIKKNGNHQPQIALNRTVFSFLERVSSRLTNEQQRL